MRRCLGLLAAVVLLFAGCGDDEDTTTTGSETEAEATNAPQAEGSLDAVVEDLNAAIAEADCEALVATTFSVLRPDAQGDGSAEPGDPVQPEECSKQTPAPALLADLEGTTFDESEDFGVAAISQGEAEKPIQGYDYWAVLWAADRDGEWRNLAFFPTDPQFEEKLGSGADPVAITEEMIEAARTGDCENAEEFFNGFVRFGEKPVDACKTLAGGTIFAPAVKAAGDDLVVEEIGSSRDYAFVGVDTGDTYFLVALATPPIKPGSPPQDEILVSEVVPVTEYEAVEPKDEK